MESVKKSIGERAQHKMQYERRVNERQIQTTEEKTDTSNALDALDARQQNTEQPEFNNEGKVDQNAEQCHDICPLPAKLTDDKTTELSNQLLESENVCLKKTVAQCQKDFAKLEAHCINLELQMQNNVLKSGQQNPFLKEKSNEAKVKNDIDAIDTINIELEHKVAKLLKENETLKRHYKEMFDSIKTTRAKNIEHTTSLIANNDKFKAQLQEKGKTFSSSTAKVESEPPNGSNADIANQCESKQALNVSAGTLLSTGLVLHQMTSDHNRSELGIQDHSNEPSSSKLVLKVVPLAVKTATSRQELELLFHHHIAMPRTTGEVTAAKIDELTLAQTLIEIKAAKPKVVTTAATTTTTTRPKGKGVVVQEPSEFRVPQESQPSISKDKGKGIMVEPEVPLKRKDQIALDEQIARDIQAKLDAELEEEQKLARKQEEEANIALIESWENTQAMMEADRLLAERLQSKEREELTDEEKGKLFMELMEKRRKHFAALRAQEKRNRPPTKAQKRTQMSTYLKHMGGYTYKQLKGKNFDEIQKLFDKEMKRVNTFVAMGSEEQESKEKKAEGSEETAKGSRKKMLGRKRAGKQQQQESSKKQKMEEDKESDEVEEVSEDDEGELLKHLVIKKDEDIAIDAIPLATKLPVIVDYKLHKEGMLVHYQLIRADGSSKRYSSMIRMLQGIDREDLEVLWRIVKAKHNDTRPEDEFERVLWGDLKVMFEPDTTSDVWRMLQGYRVTIWKLIDSSRVHFVRNLKIQKLNIKFRGGLLRLKRLQGYLRFLLHSTVSMKLLLPVEVKTAQITTVSIKISTAGTYYCLCSVSATGYKDTTVVDLQLLEDLLLNEVCTASIVRYRTRHIFVLGYQEISDRQMEKHTHSFGSRIDQDASFKGKLTD
ncbi:hypothetical protein Tco_0890862 [Tanacetum coccineum]|uniref:Uncharacterized protein n=1 Tax=Tanacetum coccineum TaxID=301880 RepID=A0ABQ5C192_9ASTR